MLRSGVLLIAVLAAAVLVTGVPAGTRSGSALATCGPSGSVLTTRDLLFAKEYGRLLEAQASTVWPGWTEVPPLLQRTRACEYLIGSADAPLSFSRLDGVTALGQPVYTARAGTFTQGVAASARKVGGDWVAMVPTRSELQRALRRTLTDSAYMGTLVREGFHAHQLSVTGGALPTFGSTLSEPQAVDLLSEVAGAEGLLAAEGGALSTGIGAASLDEARSAAADFAALTDARRDKTSNPAGLGAFERKLEWSAGTERYTDVALMTFAGSSDYTPLPGVRYSPGANYRAAFLAGLGDTTPSRDGLHGRWQGLGAAQGMLLDRLFWGWRQEALPGKDSLESLLGEAVNVPPQLTDRRVARISVGGAGMHVALAEIPAQRLAGLQNVSNLAPLDGMLFVWTENVQSRFTMRGALIPLDIAFFDELGNVVSVQQMPLCTAEPCPIYSSPVEYRYALEAPAGTLQGLPAGAKLVVPSA